MTRQPVGHFLSLNSSVSKNLILNNQPVPYPKRTIQPKGKLQVHQWFHLVCISLAQPTTEGKEKTCSNKSKNSTGTKVLGRSSHPLLATMFKFRERVMLHRERSRYSHFTWRSLATLNHQLCWWDVKSDSKWGNSWRGGIGNAWSLLRCHLLPCKCVKAQKCCLAEPWKLLTICHWLSQRRSR